MRLKGLEKVREKLPDYSGRRIIIFPMLVICSFTLGIIFQLLCDYLSLWLLESKTLKLPSSNILLLVIELLPVISTAIISGISAYILWKIIKSKQHLIEKYRQKAYQVALKRFVIGLPLLFSAGAHIWLQYFVFQMNFNLTTPNYVFYESLLTKLSILSPIEYPLRIGLSIVFLLVGILTIRMAVITLGVDYMTLLYMFFPEEARVQRHEIYSVLRHPTYFGFLVLLLGGVILNCSIYAILSYLIILFGLVYHIYRIEEKELIERFGESYLEYRRKVPALFVRLRDLGKFLRLIIKPQKN